MLKQIKTLGLSLVIGSILVTSVPVNVYGAEGPVMTPEEIMLDGYEMEEGDELVDVYGHIYDYRGVHIANEDGSSVKNAQQPTIVSVKDSQVDQLINIYKQVNFGRCDKEEEKMLKQYVKYKKIKAAAKETYQNNVEEDEEQYAGKILDDYHGDFIEYDFTEIFKGFNKMSDKRKKVITFVFVYQYNKQVEYKNDYKYCMKCKKNYITNKLSAICRKEDNCGCENGYNIVVPELTVSGAKAAVSRYYKNMDPDCEITAKETENGQIVVSIIRRALGNDTKTILIINKNTRVVENSMTGPLTK